MKTFIVAAGKGERLRPYTDLCPKCMVKFAGKPIIDYIIQTNKACGISDVIVVDGYKKEVLESHLISEGIHFVENPKYASTNMVSTLFCAEHLMDDDIIISYADIVYEPNVLQALINAPYPIATVVDLDWKKLWEIRHGDPLTDAETMKYDKNASIIELGKKPRTIADVQGQYVGLTKISKEVIRKVIEFRAALDRNGIYDGKNFDNMYMTSFIQMIIDRLMPVHGAFIRGGWLEIDSLEDLAAYEKDLQKSPVYLERMNSLKCK